MSSSPPPTDILKERLHTTLTSPHLPPPYYKYPILYFVLFPLLFRGEGGGAGYHHTTLEIVPYHYLVLRKTIIPIKCTLKQSWKADIFSSNSLIQNLLRKTICPFDNKPWSHEQVFIQNFASRTYRASSNSNLFPRDSHLTAPWASDGVVRWETLGTRLEHQLFDHFSELLIFYMAPGLHYG